MMSFDQVQQLAASGQYDVLPLSREVFADVATPIQVLQKLKSVSDHCFILESAEDSKNWGRFTFLGFDPTLEITCADGVVTITTGQGSERHEAADPNDHIRRILASHRGPKLEHLPPFTGGLVGYFAYDYAKYSEPTLLLDARDDEHFQDVDLMLFDKVIAFDHYRQKIVLIVNIATKDLAQAYERGQAQLDELKALVSAPTPPPPPPPVVASEFTATFTADEFTQMVEAAKTHIREGDIFQVVLSNRFAADFEGSLFDTYRVLRTINPSPYMFYFSGHSFEIAGASPETLVKLQAGLLHTFPLAGTRPRGATDSLDQGLERELLADEKELAEHNMLVDLGRNDLGKISQLGSVKVENYLSVLRFSHVMHLGSTVSGQISDGLGGLDAINAVLPAGTLSGAPKIRAMQIINSLEQSKRGIYGGAIGYLDFTGNMDTCIAIRIAYKKSGQVFVRSGAGIVADSDPASEYQECLNKAMAVRQALLMSAEGLD